MQEYRLYCLDGAGRIGLAEWIEAADDAHAVSRPVSKTCRTQMRSLARAEASGSPR